MITVLITTHNYGRFIEEAIESALSQDFPPDQVEILVVDDGSTDDTAERVKSYGSRIRYLYKPNGGQASALNFGIAHAYGEIVALLDADDLFLPGKLRRVAEAFQQDPSLGMVYHPLLEWNVRTGERRDRGLPLVSGDMRTLPDPFLSYVPHPTSCVSLRRSALGPLLPIPEEIRMMADCYLVQLIPLLSPILAVPEPLVLYRIHGRNNCYVESPRVSLEARKKQQREARILFDAMRRWLADNGYSYWQRHPPVRFFFHRWYNHEKLEFLTEPPGRFLFFWLMVRENHVHSPLQTWKLTTINYLASPLALIFGYKKAESMYKWRGRITEAAQRLFRGLFGAHSSSKGRRQSAC